MILLSGFLDVLFRAFVFIGLTLGVGGIVFYYFVLRPVSARGDMGESGLRRAASLIAIGAFLLAVSQLSAMVVAVWALVE